MPRGEQVLYLLGCILTEETVPPPVTQRAYKAALKNIKKPILVH